MRLYGLENSTEHSYLDWFKSRTVKKIPGAFVLGFWDTLLFQASLSEPAVLHAVLTLSSVHKRNTTDDEGEIAEDKIPDEQERFMLQHYVKAIGHLQPHLVATDRASVRVALIACVVFVGLELLRGHFQTALEHLQNGLKVLTEMQKAQPGVQVIPSQAPQDSLDEWIFEVFARLKLQVQLLEYTHERKIATFSDITEAGPSLISTFHEVGDAWQCMQQIFNRILKLAQRHESSNESDPTFATTQSDLQDDLAQFIEMLTSSRPIPPASRCRQHSH